MWNARRASWRAVWYDDDKLLRRLCCYFGPSCPPSLGRRRTALPHWVLSKRTTAGSFPNQFTHATKHAYSLHASHMRLLSNRHIYVRSETITRFLLLIFVLIDCSYNASLNYKLNIWFILSHARHEEVKSSSHLFMCSLHSKTLTLFCKPVLWLKGLSASIYILVKR